MELPDVGIKIGVIGLLEVGGVAGVAVAAEPVDAREDLALEGGHGAGGVPAHFRAGVLQDAQVAGAVDAEDAARVGALRHEASRLGAQLAEQLAQWQRRPDGVACCPPLDICAWPCIVLDCDCKRCAAGISRNVDCWRLSCETCGSSSCFWYGLDSFEWACTALWLIFICPEPTASWLDLVLCFSS